MIACPVLITLLASLAAASPLISERNNGAPLTIKTSSGTLYGTVNSTVPGVRQWLGVPYAQPPLGDLRWLPPQALLANASSRSLSVKEWAPSCNQYEPPITAYTDVLREYFISGGTSEDCLTVSIWAPLHPKKKALPVYLWIHGGGEVFGSTNVPYQYPSKWVQRSQEHIVVSIQYRLNIFGFPNAPGLEDNNVAFRDQRMAIKWASENIAAFGGDPEQMILWGQSAGGTSTLVQSAAFPDQPIVKGFVTDSPGLPPSVAQAPPDLGNFTFVASKFGCSGGDADVLACMRKVKATDIEAFLQYYQDSRTLPPISFITHPDEKIVFSNFTQRMVDGKIAKLPLIVGSVSSEGTALTPYSGSDAVGPNITAANLYTDRLVCGVAGLSKLRVALGLSTHRYIFNGNFSNISPLPWMGAYHCSELPMIFGTYEDFRGKASAFETATSEAMQDAYLAFAKNPTGGLNALGWPEYSKGKLQVFGGHYQGGNYQAFGQAGKAAEIASISASPDASCPS